MPETRPKLHLISLGCAKNLVDSEILLGGLEKSAFQIVHEPEEADTIVINTCGFLDLAREESVQVILQAAELKSTARLERLVVMGCLAQRYPEELAREIPEVDRFFGTNDHRQIVSFLTGKPYAEDDPLFFRSLLTPSHYAYLRIAEGCDNGCSFCSIPLMRGLQQSRAPEEILAEAARLVAGGVKELLLIAQDSTTYGWDLPGQVNLGSLLRELDRLEGNLRWIRVHYAHPAHLSQSIIEALAESNKVCRYLDLPVQHASNRILKSMRRGLDRDGIRHRIRRLREAIPAIRLRTTLIVGYPGETEAEFQLLCDFIEETGFDRLGVFIYSEEEGTLAAELEDDVPREVKDERQATLMDIQAGISAEKNAALVGEVLPVLVDQAGDGSAGGQTSSTGGRTNYARGRTEYDSPEVDNTVRIEGPVSAGEFIAARITSAEAFELTAIPVAGETLTRSLSRSLEPAGVKPVKA